MATCNCERESDLATAVDFALGYRGTAQEDEYMARLSKALGAYRSSSPAGADAEIRRLRAEVERLRAVLDKLPWEIRAIEIVIAAAKDGGE